jgi:hypothetical protein
LENRKNEEIDKLRREMELKIRDLEELLRKERENLEGNAKEREL